MSAIFISHSSKDNDAAIALRSWLGGHGYEGMFLDFDPIDGIPAGRDWELELHQQLRRCSAVIALCSPRSMESKWCFAEIVLARDLNKPIFPVMIESCDLPDFLKRLQVTDLRDSAKLEEAYGRLWAELRRNEIRHSFRWDVTRPPYPGLGSFSEEDAAVYFGRDDVIQRCLRRLRAVREYRDRALLLLHGVSGSGKSSLVRAGIVPRLRHDPSEWLVMTPLRRGTDPFGELAGVLSSTYADLGLPVAQDELRARLAEAAVRDPVDGQVLHDLAAELNQHSGSRDASLVLVLDQLEEFLAHDGEKGLNHSFLALVGAALQHKTGRLVVLATLRSDHLGIAQTHPALEGLPFPDDDNIAVQPMSLASIPEVIEGPARVAGVTVDPGLTGRLVAELRKDDALPLLAYTLWDMWKRGGGRKLTHQDYERLGGLDGSIRLAADNVINGLALTDENETLLRRAFVAMTRVDEAGGYARQPVRWDHLPAGSEGLLQPFIEARLLVSGTEAGTVEVAHEALFRVWPRLQHWLDNDRDFLVWRKTIMDWAQVWVESGNQGEGDRDTDLLLRGADISTAEEYVGTHVDELVGTDVPGYVAASRAFQDLQDETEARHYRVGVQAYAAAGAIGSGMGFGSAFGVVHWMEAMPPPAWRTALLYGAAWFPLGVVFGLIIGLVLQYFSMPRARRLVASGAGALIAGPAYWLARAWTDVPPFTFEPEQVAAGAQIGALLGLGVSLSEVKWIRLVTTTGLGVLAFAGTSVIEGWPKHPETVIGAGILLGGFTGASFLARTNTDEPDSARGETSGLEPSGPRRHLRRPPTGRRRASEGLVSARTIALAGLLVLVSCERPSDNGAEVPESAAALTSLRDDVYHEAGGGSRDLVQRDTQRALAEGDAVDVAGPGEGRLDFTDGLRIRVFRDSGLRIEAMADQMSSLNQVLLTGGTAYGELSGAAAAAGQRLEIRTDGAVVTALGTEFLVYYDADRNLTWVIAIEDQIRVATDTEEAIVPAGWQVWVQNDETLSDVYPATRPVANWAYPNTLPLLEYVGGPTLQDGAILDGPRCTAITGSGRSAFDAVWRSSDGALVMDVHSRWLPVSQLDCALSIQDLPVRTGVVEPTSLPTATLFTPTSVDPTSVPTDTPTLTPSPTPTPTSTPIPTPTLTPTPWAVQ